MRKYNWNTHYYLGVSVDAAELWLVSSRLFVQSSSEHGGHLRQSLNDTHTHTNFTTSTLWQSELLFFFFGPRQGRPWPCLWQTAAAPLGSCSAGTRRACIRRYHTCSHRTCKGNIQYIWREIDLHNVSFHFTQDFPNHFYHLLLKDDSWSANTTPGMGRDRRKRWKDEGGSGCDTFGSLAETFKVITADRMFSTSVFTCHVK